MRSPAESPRDMKLNTYSKLSLDTSDAYWFEHCSELDERGYTDIFGHNDSLLASDSGFGDVSKILYPYKFFAAFIAVVSVASNVYSTVNEDWRVVSQHLAMHSDDVEDDDSKGRFLVSKVFVVYVLGVEADWIESLVPALELVCLVFCVLRLLGFILCAAVYPLCRSDGTPEQKYHTSFVRWNCTAQIFLQQVPWVATFSAMKMLYYITPIVLSTQAYNLGIIVREKLQMASGKNDFDHFFMRARATFSIIWFVISRFACLLIGFDAFLVKFRIVERHVNADTASPHEVLFCVVFLFQVLSIVNLNRFIRDRLFLFLFAGEDGILSLSEEARKDVWCALLAREVFQVYGWLRFVVVMLSFDDYDYQLLVLDPRKKGDHKQESTLSQESEGKESDNIFFCSYCKQKRL